MFEESKKHNDSFSISRVLYNFEFDPPEKLRVTLDLPKQDKNNDWFCKISINGKKQLSQSVYGIDSFQSLFLSLETIRRYLEANYKSLKWEGGELGNHGYALIAPTLLKPSMITEIEKMIDSELEKIETWK